MRFHRLEVKPECNRRKHRECTHCAQRTYIAMADRRGLFNLLATLDKSADALLRRTECDMLSVWAKSGRQVDKACKVKSKFNE